MKTYKESPYYDDYDPKKNYVQILSVPRTHAQARNFTQMGTMVRDFVGRIGDAVFKNGTIIEGCTLTILGKTVQISSGKIYLDGLVREIYEDQQIGISGKGEELIGARVVEDIVTADQDASLRDPAVNSIAYGTSGANRVRQKVYFTVNDPLAQTLYKLVDGALYIVVSGNTEDNTTNIVVDMMAKRTFDEGGNFKIEGLNLIELNAHEDDKVLVGLSEGRAYIKGYEVIKPYQTKIRLRRATTTSEVANEPKKYSQGILEYQLNNYPVQKLLEVTCDRQDTVELTRGSRVDGSDDLPNGSVISIISINGYTQGTDYQLSGDKVDWSVPGGREPAGGSTYSVTYRYKYNYKLDKNEVTLTSKSVNGVSANYLTIQADSPKPVNGSQITVTYLYYLARKDTVLLDSKGEVSILEGIPARSDLTESPVNNDETKLVLGTVLLMPNSDEVYIVNQYSIRLTQSQIYDVKRRVSDLEVSLAMTDLDREAESGEQATDLKGIFTDGFVGFTKADVTNPEFNCTIDTDTNEMTLPYKTSISQLTIDQDDSETSMQVLGRVIMAPFSQVEAVTQRYATGRTLINPYSVYNAECPIKLNPEVDNWIDTSYMTVNKEKVQTMSLRRWWYHRGESWADSVRKQWDSIGVSSKDQNGWDDKVGYTTSTSTELTADEAITYMRQRKVAVQGYNFLPNEDNILCTFNEISVPLTPSGSTSSGTVKNSVRANSSGYFSASFDIPKNVPCGQVNVLLSGSVSKGSAIYKASGRKQTYTTTVLTTKTVVKTTDPIAQTFQFDQDTTITSVDLYFASVDPSKSITVQVRSVDNGYPGTTCYTEEFVSHDKIKASADGSVATNVKFSQPVYCKENTQYCFVVLTTSNVYELWYGELGGTDVRTGEIVGAQPYVNGVMFDSSNALTWTAYQKRDLKFTLYKAKWEKQGTIVFSNVTGQQMSRLLLAAQVVDYKNSGIYWYYRRLNTDSWQPLETYVDIDLPSVSNGCQLKCVMNVNYSSSPIIASDCINLVSFLDGNSATYVSRMIETEDKFTNIKIQLQACLPSAACTLTVYYKVDDGSWVKANTFTTSKVTSEFDQYNYTVEGVSGNRYRVKVVLYTPNPLIRPRVRKLINILKY